MDYDKIHLEQANRNIRLFNQLNADTNYTETRDWKVIIAFYAALHLAHARVALLMGHTHYKTQIRNEDDNIAGTTIWLTNHYWFIKAIDQSGNNPYVLGDRNDKTSFEAYKRLYALSCKARYLVGLNPKNVVSGFTNQWIIEKEVQKAKSDLNNIIGFLRKKHSTDFTIESLTEPLTPLIVP